MGKGVGALTDVDEDGVEVTEDEVEDFIDAIGGEGDGKKSAKKDKGKGAADKADDEDENVDTDTDTDESGDEEGEDSEEESDADESDESDTETGTAVEKEGRKLLKSMGLDKQFKSFKEFVSRVPEMNRQIEQSSEQLRLSNQLARVLMSRLEAKEQGADGGGRAPAKKEPLDKEAFLEQFNSDPEQALGSLLESLGYVKADRLKGIESTLSETEMASMRRDFASAVEAIPGCREVARLLENDEKVPKGLSAQWDAIMSEMGRLPKSIRAQIARGTISDRDAIDLVWDRVKAKFPGGKEKPPVGKVPAGKKAAVQTDKGKGSRPAAVKSGTEPDFSKMTSKQIFEWHQKRGLTM